MNRQTDVELTRKILPTASNGPGAFNFGGVRPLGAMALLRRCSGAVALAAACWTGMASADPPYGDYFDAPSAHEEAVSIDPNAPGTSYRGSFTVYRTDTDFYQFSVAQGEAIEIRCTAQPFAEQFKRSGFDDAGDTVMTIHHPCAATLISPAGVAQPGAWSVDGSAIVFSVADAAGGQWWLGVAGVDSAMAPCLITFCDADYGSTWSAYYFSVVLAPGDADDERGGGAGSFGWMASLLLSAAILLRRWLGALAIVLAACWTSMASADPPYGDDFDAPDVWEGAVSIDPNAPGLYYWGDFEILRTDTDFYQFSVAQGQTIEIRCAAEPYGSSAGISHPCAATLIAPAGVAQPATPSVDGVAIAFSVADAAGGQWRLGIAGFDPKTVFPCLLAYCKEGASAYYFSVVLGPGGASNERSGGAGSLGWMAQLLLGAAILIRRRLGALAILITASWTGVASADPPYGDDFDAPGVYEAAVAIKPGLYRGYYQTLYRGYYQTLPAGPPDTDSYRFIVAQGQDIEIQCTSDVIPYGKDGWWLDITRHPCTATLLDPTGTAQVSTISASGTALAFSVANAAGGEWQLTIAGDDVGQTVTGAVIAAQLGGAPPGYCLWEAYCQVSQYLFSLTLSPNRAADAERGGGAGSFGWMATLLLGAAVMLPRRRLRERF